MNLILLFDDDFESDGRVRLRGRRARHVHEVHRASVGDPLNVGRLDGPMGTGTVLAVARDEVVLDVRLETAPPAPPGIDLLLAMPRPKMLRRVLQGAASMGVKRLVIVNSYRVEKSYFDSPLAAPDEIRENLVLGLEQGRDTALPEVRIEKRFKPFVEDSLDALWPESTRKLLPHPVGERTLATCDAGTPAERAVVAVGPEGGWIPYEVSMLEARGFQTFTLGPRILRVDVAVPFLLGQLELVRRLRAPGAAASPGTGE